MDIFSAQARMIEKSVGQYINFSRMLQDSIITAVDFNLKTSKNYMKWLSNKNSTSITRIETETKKNDVSAIENPAISEPQITTKVAENVAEKKIVAKNVTKSKSKNALYQV